MKKVSYDATVKALHELRAGWIRSGIKYAIVANALELLDNQHEALACKDAAIAEQARQLKEALAALEQVRGERDAAVRDIKAIATHYPCYVCAHSQSKRSHGCDIAIDLQDDKWNCAENDRFEWRGPCAENGGAEDGI